MNDIRTDETDDRRVTRIINLRCYTVVTGEPDVVTRDGEWNERSVRHDVKRGGDEWEARKRGG